MPSTINEERTEGGSPDRGRLKIVRKASQKRHSYLIWKDTQTLAK